MIELGSWIFWKLLLNIEKYAAKGEKAFYEEELIQIWIIHYIQIAGEAANQLSDSVMKNH